MARSEKSRKASSEMMRLRWADPEWRAKRGREVRAQWQNPEHRRLHKAGYDATREKRKAALRACLTDPQYKARQLAGIKAWQGQHSHTCPACGQVFTGGRLAKRCVSCRGKSGARLRRAVPQLLLRDGPNCRLCNEAIDFASYHSADSVSVDHIKPLGRGGTDDLSNLQLAHLRCNSP